MENSIEKMVQRAQAGDEEAISQLYEQTYNSVYQSVRALVKDEDEALDIVQDSYIKGFQHLDKLEEPEKFQAWMKVIAANHARDYLRKKRPALFSERIDEDGEEIDLGLQDKCLDHMPEEVIDRQETTRLINDILGNLKAEQRLAIVMYYYEEMSVREIAKELGCSENTVKSRLKYARDKIEVEVRNLEKKGTKLYSLAPMPFFTWLLRMAKQQGISFALDKVDAVMATGAARAAVAEEVSAATGAAATAGEAAAAAGSSVSGSAAAGTAVKAAGTVAGKTVATKVVAGTLAVTMAAGVGVVAVNSLGTEKENEAAHVVYEEFLGRYEHALGLEFDIIWAEKERFWAEISQDILAQNPELDLSVIHSWYLDYTPGEGYGEGISAPNTMYDPNMDDQKMMSTTLEDQEIRAAYHDFDDDGIDEMVVARFYRGELDRGSSVDVYAVKDNQLYRGEADWVRSNDVYTWTLRSTEIVNYVDPGVVYVSLGKGYFEEPMTVDEPDLDWQVLYPVGQEEKPIDEIPVETEPTEPAATEDPYVAAIENLAGSYTYAIPLDVVVESHHRAAYSAFHELRITVTDTEIIIEDLGEPQKSMDNRNAFIQFNQEHGYILKEEELQYMVFDNLGTMRIDRSSIVFLDEEQTGGDTIITFNETCFEGPTAPTGYVDAMRINGICFFYYAHSENANGKGLLMQHGPNYQRFVSVNGIQLNRQ